MKKHVVIIGGGFGGQQAASRLKHANVDVTLIDRRNHHLFQPLLYQVATGALSPADIATPLRSLFKHQKNVRVLLGEVTDLDVERRRVILRDGVIDYDKLIVAAGAGSSYFGKDQWERFAPSLKSIEDATEIRRRILGAFEAAERESDPEAARAWLTFVIIGGGPTGVEMAGALAEVAYDSMKHDFRSINPADARVILVQSRDRVLPTFDPYLSAQAAASLQRLGVEVRTGGRVTNVDSSGITLSAGDEQEFIPARTVLWTAGVAASPLGKVLSEAAGVELDNGGRVIVQPDLSLPGHPDIFVIGDLAHVKQPSGEALPGVAQVAIQEGRYVGDLIARRLRGRDLPPFRYHDRGNMATIGRGAAVAEIGRLRLSGWLAWPIWLVIHLMYQADVENRVLVLIQWLWNYVTRKRSALLITERHRDFSRQMNIPAKLATDTGTFSRAG
jgi:NADH dehydrogenase